MKGVALVWTVAALAAAAGCGSTPEAAAPIAAPDPTPIPVRVQPIADTRGAHTLLVLVNTADELFRVDPATLDLTSLGRFSFPDGAPDPITDVAVDRKGRMWAVGFEAVYRVDPSTLACTLLARHEGHELNALAIMTAAMVSGREVPDVMIAAENGTSVVSQVDPVTGALTPVGDLGGGLVSGGDLTWAPGVGAVLIATDGHGYEGVVRVDPDTFTAHPLDTGWSFEKVRGLTMLPEGLLGVSERGELIQIDPATGAATLRKSHPLVFFGGAVGWDDRPQSPLHP